MALLPQLLVHSGCCSLQYTTITVTGYWILLPPLIVFLFASLALDSRSWMNKCKSCLGHLFNSCQRNWQSRYLVFSEARVEGNALPLTKTQKMENLQTQKGSSKAKEFQKPNKCLSQGLKWKRFCTYWPWDVYKHWLSEYWVLNAWVY